MKKNNYDKLMFDKAIKKLERKWLEIKSNPNDYGKDIVLPVYEEKQWNTYQNHCHNMKMSMKCLYNFQKEYMSSKTKFWYVTKHLKYEIWLCKILLKNPYNKTNFECLKLKIKLKEVTKELLILKKEIKSDFDKIKVGKEYLLCELERLNGRLKEFQNRSEIWTKDFGFEIVCELEINIIKSELKKLNVKFK